MVRVVMHALASWREHRTTTPAERTALPATLAQPVPNQDRVDKLSIVADHDACIGWASGDIGWHGDCAGHVMETQGDYEADVLLAVFPSASIAAEAERAFQAAGIESSQSPLGPGRYQLADLRLGSRFRAGIGAAIVGAIVGAGIGAGLAVWLFGASGMVILGLAVAGAFGGAIVGPLFGIERVARYDDDLATSMQIGPESSAVVLRARVPPTGARESARDIVEHAGAIALLDVPMYEARVRGTAEPTVVESTSAGDAAAGLQAAPFGPTKVQGAEERNRQSRRPAA